ncbi:hypothetical protein OG21DRAFT_1478190 [Imleria badia]|nr:hypothetical protein OG21DRAFT_1478190 [Imleria badia]
MALQMITGEQHAVNNQSDSRQNDLPEGEGSVEPCDLSWDEGEFNGHANDNPGPGPTGQGNPNPPQPEPQQYAYEYDQGPAAEVLAAGHIIYYPFADREEWELTDWLIRNINQRATNEFLKLSITRSWTQPSYQSKHTFMKVIDQLLTGSEWRCELMHVHGDDETHVTDQNPGNDGTASDRATFSNELAYAPEKVYTDPQAQTRQYDEMRTGEWWGKPRFKGDKVAWPVYLTIGNILKEVCHQPAHHASILLGYIPVVKVDVDTFENHSVAGYHLFHYCMRLMLQPLVAAGREGVEIVCVDGWIRQVYPILVAFIGDHPEQCLRACGMENRCPKCHVLADQRGANTQFPLHNQEQTVRVLHAQASGQYPPKFVAEGLRPVFSPFWANLPHTDIFMCITSDILHQLHQGLFKDHLKKWCTTIVGKKCFDSWFCAIPIHPELHHFKEGISKIKQWTGADNKQLQRVLVTALVGTTPNHDVIQASHALLDFISLAQYQSHTDDTLQGLQHVLDKFHTFKNIFIDLRCHTHFNLPKFHSLCHYVDSIRLFSGSLDGFNTENSERLHIDYTKKAYAASNQKDYMIQMTKWLTRQEAVVWFKTYLTWCLGSSPSDCSASQYSDSDAGSAMCPNLNWAFPLATPYRIAICPHFPKKLVSYLIQNHGTSFLGNLGPGGNAYFVPTLHDCFDCFSNVRIPLWICSHPECANRPRKPPIAGQWETVLVQTDTGKKSDRCLLAGLCMAKVHIIFRLPPHLGLFPDPLTYIHWFKPLHAFDEDVKMFCFECSIWNHLLNTVVIPITHLVQPCHLVPRFPNGTFDPRWIHGDVMTTADLFYLNRYINLRTFEQYQVHRED